MLFDGPWKWQKAQGKESLGGPDLGLRVMETEQRRYRENLARVPTPHVGQKEVFGLSPN
jgi:hypothetical protein